MKSSASLYVCVNSRFASACKAAFNNIAMTYKLPNLIDWLYVA